jgi:hypothetical protein
MIEFVLLLAKRIAVSMNTLSSPLTSLSSTIQHVDRTVEQSPVGAANLAESRELNRLFTAAVVSRRFCRLLLSDARTAVRSGYNGEMFALTLQEVDLLTSIRAANLADFAAQLITKLANPSPSSVEHTSNYGVEHRRQPVASDHRIGDKIGVSGFGEVGM